MLFAISPHVSCRCNLEQTLIEQSYPDVALSILRQSRDPALVDLLKLRR